MSFIFSSQSQQFRIRCWMWHWGSQHNLSVANYADLPFWCLSFNQQVCVPAINGKLIMLSVYVAKSADTNVCNSLQHRVRTEYFIFTAASSTFGMGTLASDPGSVEGHWGSSCIVEKSLVIWGRLLLHLIKNTSWHVKKQIWKTSYTRGVDIRGWMPLNKIIYIELNHCEMCCVLIF